MPSTTAGEIVYPESDGAPMGENTLQVKWIHALLDGFQLHLRYRPDVFLASDLFWYPVEGDPETVTAPDLMFAFGRPKGERSSYKQWEEDGVAPQVVVEVLSPSNTPEKRRKLAKFYDRHGVEEFYEYDPAARVLTARVRTGRKHGPATPAASHTSARLGVRFEVPADGELRVIGPDGRPFLTHLELADDALAKQERLVEERQMRIEAERKESEARAEADRLRAQLRALGIDPGAN